MIFIGLIALKIEICTVFGCEKPSIYAGLRLITITLLRPKNRVSFMEARFFMYYLNYQTVRQIGICHFLITVLHTINATVAGTKNMSDGNISM